MHFWRLYFCFCLTLLDLPTTSQTHPHMKKLNINITKINYQYNNCARKKKMKLRPIRFYQKYQELRARIKANSCPVLPATPASGGGVGVGGVIGGVNTTVNSNYSVQRSASLKDHRQLRYVFLPMYAICYWSSFSTGATPVTTLPILETSIQ